MQEETCSRLSLEAGEPLAGTAAAETSFWIAIEHSAAWGPKGLDDSGLPDSVAQHVNAFLKSQPRARAQLIRRPDRTSGARTVYLARATPGACALWQASFDSLEELSAVDLEGWAQGGEPAGFSRSSEALYLVCVHGRRDRCCAQRGMPVYSALDGALGSSAWQTSHLGGHRFAATLVVLPEGVCYGRIEADEAPALIAAQRAGKLHDLARLRGRCAYSSEVQAAEIALREQLQERELDAVRPLASEKREDGVYVRLLHVPSQREHELRITHRELPPFPQSCGASHRPGDALVALTSR